MRNRLRAREIWKGSRVVSEGMGAGADLFLSTGFISFSTINTLDVTVLVQNLGDNVVDTPLTRFPSKCFLLDCPGLGLG